MRISYPPIKVGIPHEKDIVLVLKAICRHAQLSFSDAFLQIEGANQKGEFTEIGIKLCSHDQTKNKFSIPVVIGCGTDSVRAFIGYKEDNHVLFGNVLFERLRTRFCGRKFIVSEKILRELRKEELYTSNGNGIGKHAETLPQVSEGESESDETQKVDDLLIDGAQAEVPVSNEETPDDPSHYHRFFDNPENLHLASVALVSTFKINEPFGFLELINLLVDEVGMPRTVELKLMMSKVHVFVSRKLIKKLNPDQRPAKYCLTQLAFDYAIDKTLLPMPTHKVRLENPTPLPLPPKVQVPSMALATGVARIKEVELRFQSLHSELKGAESRLVSLDENKINEEDVQLDNQKKNLEERLVQIELRKKELIKERENLSKIKNEILQIKQKLESKEIADGHKEFLELKNLLLG